MTLIQPQIIDGKTQFSNVNHEGFWKVGQILTIGEIVTHKGVAVESLMLEPQGIAHLVSKECVHLPETVCGLAHVLTGMCNKGLLTLGIGVIDPGWENRLSTPVLNFSSERRLLQVGDQFIRITFHRICAEPGVIISGKDKNVAGGGGNKGEEDYKREVRARAVGNFGKNFLNIKQLVGQASKKEGARLKETMLKYLPIGAFSLAFFALLVTVGIATVVRFASDSRDAEILKRLESLDQRQQQLQDEMHQSQSTRAQPSKSSQSQPKRAP